MLLSQRAFHSFMLCAICALLPMTSLIANAEKIMIVASHSGGAYQEVIQGITSSPGLSFEVIDLSGNPGKKDEAMQKISAGAPSAILPLGELAIKSLDALKNSAPVVYTMVFDPVHSDKHAYSGVVLKIDIKTRLSKIRDLFPNVKRVGMLFNSSASASEVADARALAPGFDLTIFALPVDTAAELPTALKKLSRDAVDVIMLVPDVTIANPAVLKAIMEHAQDESLPVVGLSAYHMKSGATAAFIVDFKDIGLQTAELARTSMVSPGTAKTLVPRKIVIQVSTSLQKKMNLEMKLSSDIQMTP